MSRFEKVGRSRTVRRQVRGVLESVGGWNRNWYTDELIVELAGPQADWIAVSGDLESVGGFYQ